MTQNCVSKIAQIEEEVATMVLAANLEAEVQKEVEHLEK